MRHILGRKHSKDKAPFLDEELIWQKNISCSLATFAKLKKKINS